MYRIQVTRCVDVASDSGSYGVSQHSCKAITSLPCVMTIAYQLCPARFSVAWPGQIAGMPTMAKRGYVQPHLSLYIFSLCIKSFFNTTFKLDHFQHAATLLWALSQAVNLLAKRPITVSHQSDVFDDPSPYTDGERPKVTRATCTTTKRR